MVKVIASNINEAKRELTRGMSYYHVLRELLRGSMVEAEIYSSRKSKNPTSKFTFNESDFISWCYKYHNITCKEILYNLLDEVRYNSNIKQTTNRNKGEKI